MILTALLAWRVMLYWHDCLTCTIRNASLAWFAYASLAWCYLPYSHYMQRPVCTICNALPAWHVMHWLYPPMTHLFNCICNNQVTSALLAELLTRRRAFCLWACVCNNQVTSAPLAELLTRRRALCLWARACNNQVTSALLAEFLTRRRALCLWAPAPSLLSHQFPPHFHTSLLLTFTPAPSLLSHLNS